MTSPLSARAQLEATFDPDELPPEYDDRPARIVKVPDPVRQKINRGNRQRGKVTERKWAELVAEAVGVPVKRQGTLGGADVVHGTYAFEVKHRKGDWPSNTTIKNALVQAANNAGSRTPVVVACKTTHNSREWRVYSAVGVYVDGKEWLRTA